MPNNATWLARTTINAILQPKCDRKTTVVLDEYSAGWESYRRHLEACKSLEDWLLIKGVEDQPTFCNVSGKLKFEAFDSINFNRQTILSALKREFSDATSVTEFGCGVGRNLLFLKHQMPHLKCYGYELCKPGVELGTAAATKFGLDVSYSQLDYVSGAESEYVFPATDVAFTMYSLEQLPITNGQAVKNILKHVTKGSIHLEPVPENYPFSYRGILGRLDHWKADYIRNFERNVVATNIVQIQKTAIDSAHNPLMFPSLYILKKKPG